MPELVTIVTPSYNQAQYLEAALLSVLEQDYPHIEYLVVDGGSSDGSLEIIQRHASRFAWWISEPDAGQAEAINKGLQRASGEIVAWLNSDDLYLPGAVSRAVRLLRANPGAGLVYGDGLSIDGEGRPIKWLRMGDWGLADLLRFRILCQPAVFMRREVLRQAGYLDPKYHYMLDHHLWIRMARLAAVLHAGNEPAPWAAARQHPAAKNVAQAPGFGRETLRLLEWMRTQPDLASHLERDRHRVQGGAYRLNARYLLDGGLPGGALRSYGRALLSDPPYALRHWHRMLFALASLLGAGGLARYNERFRRPQRRRAARELSGLSGLEGWPGLALQPTPHP